MATARWTLRLPLVIVLVSTALPLQGCIQGDRSPPPGVPIVNRTEVRLKVYSELREGRVLVADLAPGETGESSGPCVLKNPLVAETTGGREVARYGPFGECDRGPFIIRS